MSSGNVNTRLKHARVLVPAAVLLPQTSPPMSRSAIDDRAIGELIGIMLLCFRRRWKRKASIVLVGMGALWLAGGCLHPLPGRNPSLSIVSYELSQYQSATGMRVTLEHTADTGLAGAVLVIGAGSADDGAERSGSRT